MEKTVSAAEANRKFSELLHGVRKGASYVVTLCGEPVARLVPTRRGARSSPRARKSLLIRLKFQPTGEGVEAGRRWRREELYDDKSEISVV
jgi:prevent-host-death family protein